ncbi:MAG: AAA family ATPase, partial [Lachnospiraceae bacterium]|nr:AAA family ATPase [Lachnospiraceae bacterium]
MGIYLNPSNEGFLESIRSKIYVDKTGLIGCINECLCTERKFVCVSRPRRFGKSMALKMLAAYYGYGNDSRKLFQGLKIENNPTFEEHLNRYDVICLNMQQFLIEAGNMSVTQYLEADVLNELKQEYPGILSADEIRLGAAFRQIYAKTGRKFVFLIDEWDCIMRERQKAEELQKQYLDFLRYLLKDQLYVALVYMTGILPIKKYGVHSALNMFTEYSMINQGVLEEYTGFTEEEVKGLCRRFDMDFEETSNWYDGYRLKKFPHVYNPKEVVAAMSSRDFLNYWTLTET